MNRIDLSVQATQAALAELVGVTQPTISNLMTEGKLPSAGTLGELVLAYCQRLRDQAAARLGSDVGGLDLVQERAALAHEQRQWIALKNAALRREFAPVTVLAEVLATTSGAVADRFDLLPEQIDHACPNLPDAARRVVLNTLEAARREWVRCTAVLAATHAEVDQADQVEEDEGELDA